MTNEKRPEELKSSSSSASIDSSSPLYLHNQNITSIGHTQFSGGNHSYSAPHSRSHSRASGASGGSGSPVIEGRLSASPVLLHNPINTNSSSSTSSNNNNSNTINSNSINASSLLTTAIANLQHQHLEPPSHQHQYHQQHHQQPHSTFDLFSPSGSTTTPPELINRNSSLTNLSNHSNGNSTSSTNNNLFMRKPSERRNSLGSPFSHTSNDMSSTMPIQSTASISASNSNRNLYTIQSQARNPQNTINSITPRKYGGGLTVLTNTLNSSSTDKKRLVDQFYNAATNESNPVSRAGSLLDIKSLSSNIPVSGSSSGIKGKSEGNSINNNTNNNNNSNSINNSNNNGNVGGGASAGNLSSLMVNANGGANGGHHSNLSSLNPSPSLEVTNRRDDLNDDYKGQGIYDHSNNNIPIYGINDEIFNDIVKQGGFKYDSRNSNLFEDDELMNYLKLHDIIIHDEDIMSNDHKGDNTGIERFRTEIKLISQDLIDVNRKLINNRGGGGEIQTNLNDLRSLEDYLDVLNHQTKELMNQLIEDKEELKNKYQKDINDSINRLEDLSQELTNLETKLTILRNKINHDKSFLTHELTEKLKVLEYVDEKMKDYSVVSRIRRFKQFNISMSVIIVIIGLYMYYR